MTLTLTRNELKQVLLALVAREYKGVGRLAEYPDDAHMHEALQDTRKALQAVIAAGAEADATEVEAEAADEPYVSTHPLFRSLTVEEVRHFRQHARESDPPEGIDPSVLHPVCVAEWRRRGKL